MVWAGGCVADEGGLMWYRRFRGIWRARRSLRGLRATARAVSVLVLLYWR